MFLCLGLAATLFVAQAGTSVRAPSRTVVFDTNEVTEASVALSPDGSTLVFTLLGHLFRMQAATGGEAQQLTFGPYYDGDPAFSPDGTTIAFVSDRGAREGRELGVFVVDASTREIRSLTADAFAIRPTFTSSGDAIAYLAVPPQPAYPGSLILRRIAVSGGAAETLRGEPDQYRSIFRMPDGRIAWSIAERTPGSESKSRIETPGADGRPLVIVRCDGILERVEASPGGEGVFARRSMRRGEELVEIATDTDTGAIRVITPVDAARGPRPRFAAGRPSTLYVGDQGHVYSIDVSTGARHVVPMRARVKLDIADPVPAKWPGAPASPVIVNPLLTPDGTLIFQAAGHLFLQQPDGSRARRLAERDTDPRAFEASAALSPDGKRLAYVRSRGIDTELRVLALDSGDVKTIATGGGYGQPSWSADGARLVMVESAGFSASIVSIGSDGTSRREIGQAGFWSARPNLSPDGRSLYTTANVTGVGNVYRQALDAPAGGNPEAVTAFTRHASDGLLSRDGKWLAFRRNKEIWIAALAASGPIVEASCRRIADAGGDGFSFTADSKALIYAVGPHVFTQPLPSGARAEIPIHLDLPHPAPAPVLIRGVRVLDFDAKTFGPPTSVFLDDGRIAWIGEERGRSMPRETVTLEAAGKFAIPGLFDMHAHAVGANQEAFIAYGVTSVRDTGGSLVGASELADRAATSGDPIPRYFFAGEIFEGAHPYWGDGFLQIQSEEDARSYVRRFQAAGASFIKVYPSLPWLLQLAVIDEARAAGIPVVGHGMSVNEITRSVTHGFATIEHTVFPLRTYDDVARMLAASGTRWDPTLAVMGGDSQLLRKDAARLADAKLRALTPLSMIESATSAGYEKDVRDDELAKTWAAQLTSVRDAYARGVKLAIGTDAPNPACFYGASLHWELEFFAAAGIPPIDVLRIATADAARSLGAADLGVIAPGKLADLVLLNANPLENIKNTQSIWRTLKAGWVFTQDR